MSAMPMRPTLLRQTRSLSTSERITAFVRGELESNGCTISDLAKILDVSQHGASRLWHGRRKRNYTVPELVRIAVAFEVDPWDLLKRVVSV
ncbi:helix-turn-helix domain-containing protein [Rathayibacter soli]|uniref:helix-turn-helix domain-containing protein n=1 Tax=Rathayibacter soli TaxID=3144168 RepID=UPI0027E445D0|nr:helix-turn-helix transcriptional regulator [Glaciibacter superstes]